MDSDDIGEITIKIEATIFLDGKEFVSSFFNNADNLKLWFDDYSKSLNKLTQKETKKP